MQVIARLAICFWYVYSTRYESQEQNPTPNSLTNSMFTKVSPMKFV